MSTACRLFPELISPDFQNIESVFLTAKYTKETQSTQRGYEVGGEWYEIPHCVRNDSVMYETGNAAAVNYEPLFCSCAAATSVSGQRVIPSVAQRSEESRTNGRAAPCCLWAAVAHREADGGRAGGYSMSLEFLVLFFQEKSTEEKEYDPVIGRFFSPDKYVQN